MTAPVQPLGVDSLVTVPYMTVASFKASPTFLDLQNLVSGSNVAADQAAELYNQLLKASAWICSEIDMPVHAASVTENVRMFVDRDGAMRWHATRKPVKMVTAVTYGYSSGTANQRAITDLSGLWIENGVQIVMPFGPMSSAFNAIQFGPPAVSTELFTSWTYTAGYANTILGASTIAGATSITVADPTGIVPGDILRIWDPGKEEACTVAGSYVLGSAVVPLTAGLSNAHTVAGTAVDQRIGVSQIPADIQLAMAQYAMALLVRPDTTAEDSWPSSAKISTKKKGSVGSRNAGLINSARSILANYVRVR